MPPYLKPVPVLILFLSGFIMLLAGCDSESNSDRLHALMDEAEEFEIRENPFRGGDDGEYQENDRLQSVAMEDLERRYEFWSDIQNQLESDVTRDELDLSHQITYDSFKRQVDHNVNQHRYRSYLVPMNHEGGFFNRLVGLENRVPLDSLQNYEDYITRLNAVPNYFNQHIEHMRTGMEEGYTLPSVIFVDDYDHYFTSAIVDEATESSFYEPFEDFPSSISESDRERLAEEGRAAIEQSVMPAYRSLADFLTNEYIPAARETIATADLPDGEDYYNHLIEYHTTLPMTAEEVHQVGLDEVERIRNEMYEIIEEVGFEGSFDEFLEFLRTDPQFFVDEPEDLLKEASYHSKRMDGKLPEIFHIHTLPRRPYGVQPVPDHLAPRYTGGRYSLGGGTRAGEYWVNTYNLPSRTLYTLEALTYHEAVPGHHLQIGLNQEMDDLPRRAGGLTAFSEGWALYAERLGLDVGLYDDPYSNFGRLTYEMWRACRLVVDTGMHALGWSREDTINFMTENTALSHHEIDTETNRYIAWPGQALAYKMGELKIRELRETYEEELGDDFDIRDFHEAVLKNGPVTLPVLEQQVADFFENRDQ
ncbi:DUF885 domain-containing protein [Rhodohalobacter sp. SW132]|uniref:DUF885 domain-containing protein n=1 Tax=Rhodohalobacter sp. SW132 TaxID=2293433 RepID=UPI000E26812F|nr:DUF885 domain-containing protein [Rhodohalobacter sp. SW132]REL38031.1 DUF885 domain-containing protein [Rhodohalobacter sp. SW132]